MCNYDSIGIWDSNFKLADPVFALSMSEDGYCELIPPWYKNKINH